MLDEKREKDLIWIGNWGDEERTRELETFLIEPARDLGLTGTVYGVRYPEGALETLKRCRLTYSGWLANADVPAAFARHSATVHIPRRPYVEALPGIPTIRVFEALACGIPLVCAVWDDAEGLFRPGVDFLVARDSEEMTSGLRAIFYAPDLAASLAAKGLETVLARHTCTHRVDELLEILAIVGTMRVRHSVLANEAAE
jgi:spore maturation protein CgeB